MDTVRGIGHRIGQRPTRIAGVVLAAASLALAGCGTRTSSGGTADLLTTNPGPTPGGTAPAALVVASTSTLEARSSTPIADGATPVTLTVVACDVADRGVAGANVVLSTTGSATLTQPTPTDATGTTSGTIVSGVLGPQTISAAIVSGGKTTILSTRVVFGAPVPGGPGYPTAARLTAAPAAGIVANGAAASRLTLLLKDPRGKPVVGARVQITATGTGNTIAQPGPTDATGTATGSIASTSAGTKTVTATATIVGGGSLSATATVTFVVGTLAGSGSTIGAAPSTVVADGASAATITVTAADSTGNPLPGARVVLGASGTGNTLVQPAGVTGSNGVATGRLTSTRAGTKAITATVTIGGTSVTVQTSATFVAGTPSAATSTLTATPASGIVANGSTIARLAVSLRDANGNPVSGATVLLASSGSANTISQPATATDATGFAAGSIASTVPETKATTATATIGAATLALRASVTFVPVPTLVFTGVAGATPATQVLADGQTTSTIAIAVTDGTGKPVSGVAVSLASTGTGNTIVQPAATGALGTTTGTLASTVAELKTVTATLLTPSGPQVVLVTVGFIAGAPSAATSTIAATPATGLASDGVATTRIALVVRDALGNPVPGAAVSLGASGIGNTLSLPAATSATGATSATLASTAAGSKTINATVVVGSTTLSLATTATFVPGAPSAATSTLVASPATVVADGTAVATLTVVVKDAGGNPVPGVAVSLGSTGTGNTIVQAASVTDALGTASGTIASTVPEAKTIDAVLATGAVTLNAPVTFTSLPIDLPSSGAQLSPTTVLANGVATTTITVAVRDGLGRPVPGAAVALAASGSGNVLSSALLTTPASGTVSATLASTVAEPKTITVTLNPGPAQLVLTSTLAATFVALPIPRYAFVADSTDGAISVYSVNAAGSLTNRSTTLSGATPCALAVDAAGKLVYAADSGSNDVAALAVGPGGFLTRVGFAPAGTTPVGLALHPSGKFLYAASAGSGDVTAFTIDPATGLLTALPAVAAGSSPAGLALDPTGSFLFVANGGSGDVSSFAIDPVTGALTKLASTTAGLTPSAIALDPVAPFLYVANSASNDVWAYSLDPATGALTLVGTTPAGTGPAALAMDPLGRALYVASAGSSDVTALAIQPTGALTLVGTVAVAGAPRGISIDGPGAHVYVAATASDQVAAFAIGAGGALTPLGRTISGAAPVAVALSSGGAPVTDTPRFAIVGNRSTNDLSIDSIDAATGGLTQVGVNVATGAQPRGEAIDPTRRFLYVANAGDNTITSYALDPVAGTLTPLGVTPSPSLGTLCLAIDPSGRFLVLLDDVAGNLAVFGVAADGSLTLVGAPVPTGSLPAMIRFDPSGRFLYVPELGSNDVLAFSFDRTTGTLTPLGAPVSTGPNTGPSSFAIDPSGSFAYSVNAFADPVTKATVDSIDIFQIDPVSGALTLTGVVPSGGVGPFDTEVSPSGQVLYCVNIGSATVAEFARDPATGAISLIGAVSTGPVTGQPQGLALSSNGAFAFVPDRRANELATFTVAGDGTLTPGTPVTTGVQPRSVILVETSN